MKITQGPNLMWYVFTILVLLICHDLNSIMPLVYWIGLNVIFIPLSLWLHAHNERASWLLIFRTILLFKQNMGENNVWAL